ncbi:MAG TPA: CAP domain-containing protein, partial [Sporichthya sp.]|nr:CAP domain-containing protein [Sporichthya sp.]
MNQLKKAHGGLFLVAFLTAAGLLATAAPGLAAEQSGPAAPLTASAPAHVRVNPADDDPDDESSPDDPDDSFSGNGWWQGGYSSDQGDPPDADSSSDHFGTKKPTKAERAAAKRSSGKHKHKSAARKRAARRAAARDAAHQRAAQQPRGAVADGGDNSPRSGGSADTMRDAILDLTNRARQSAGCGSLRYSTELERSAQAHAIDMSDHHYMSHQSRSGRNSDQRIRATGFHGDKTGENL